MADQAQPILSGATNVLLALIILIVGFWIAGRVGAMVRGVELTFGVSYDTDIDKARDVTQKSLRRSSANLGRSRAGRRSLDPE